MSLKTVAQAYLEDRSKTDVLPTLQEQLRGLLASLQAPLAHAGDLRVLTELHQAQAEILADHGVMHEPVRLAARLEDELRGARGAVRTALEATLHLLEAEKRLAPAPPVTNSPPAPPDSGGIRA